MIRIALVDYGVGNLHSMRKALELCGAEVFVSSDPRVMKSCDAIVLPGVGAFKGAMERMPKEAIVEEVASGKPTLGVCLGMQLLFGYNEEGNESGLDLLKGRVARLPATVKLPHIGWNLVEVVRRHPIVAGIPDKAYMYFVHSYYVEPEDRGITVASSRYGVEFPSIVASGDIIGTQFHPEKSGRFGRRLIENFIDLLR